MKSKDTFNVAGELVEAILDSTVLEDTGVYKEIPVISTLIGVINVWSELKARAFQKKFIAFIDEFDAEQFENLKKAVSKKTEDELGLEIFNAIDKVEKSKQARMIARATKIYIANLESGINDKFEFEHNMYAIKQLDDYLLTGLHFIYGDNSTSRVRSVDQALFNLGLVKQTVKEALAGATIHPEISFEASEIGNEFYRNIVLDEPLS